MHQTNCGNFKNILYTKAAERVDAFRPYVATTIFGEQEEESSDEGEE
jgi:hypothetical protein